MENFARFCQSGATEVALHAHDGKWALVALKWAPYQCESTGFKFASAQDALAFARVVAPEIGVRL